MSRAARINNGRPRGPSSDVWMTGGVQLQKNMREVFDQNRRAAEEKYRQGHQLAPHRHGCDYVNRVHVHGRAGFDRRCRSDRNQLEDGAVLRPRAAVVADVLGERVDRTVIFIAGSIAADPELHRSKPAVVLAYLVCLLSITSMRGEGRSTQSIRVRSRSSKV